jgi:hypothetical protein
VTDQTPLVPDSLVPDSLVSDVDLTVPPAVPAAHDLAGLPDPPSSTPYLDAGYQPVPPGYPPPGYAPPGYAPPGYAPPGYAAPGSQQPPTAPPKPSRDPSSLVAGARRFSGSSTLMLIGAAVCHVLGLIVPSSGRHPFFDLGLWAVFGLACLVMLCAPLVAGALKLSPVQAWKVAGAGCVGLAFHWLAFVVPILEKNASFFMTLGFGAALWSTYLAPGRAEALAKTS